MGQAQRLHNNTNNSCHRKCRSKRTLRIDREVRNCRFASPILIYNLRNNNDILSCSDNK